MPMVMNDAQDSQVGQRWVTGAMAIDAGKLWLSQDLTFQGGPVILSLDEVAARLDLSWAELLARLNVCHNPRN